jgi:hypothetical protein
MPRYHTCLNPSKTGPVLACERWDVGGFAYIQIGSFADCHPLIFPDNSKKSEPIP